MLNNIGVLCTACKACASICLVNAIKFKNDNYDVAYPYVDENLCIDCNCCNKACHIQNERVSNAIDKSYIGYSLLSNREKSASGGICSAIYELAVKNEWISFGVEFTIGKGAYYISISSLEEISRVRNSKYVYSDMTTFYYSIENVINKNATVVFVGLPCQIAAAQTYMDILELSKENAYFVEIICHGVAPYEYLDKHIKTLEKKIGEEAEKISFRDEEFTTKNYVFTLRKKNKIIYKKNDKSTDAYQIGYHQAVIYRENCYHCAYAKRERNGDLVVADWYYDGKSSYVNFDSSNISSILCCTDKGSALLQRLCTEGYIYIQERPVSEALNVQKTLTKPHDKNKGRRNFLMKYTKSKDFDKSIKKACWKIIIKNKIKEVLKI